MKHVIDFGISMGKSYMVIYNAQKQCIFEQKLKHSKPTFEELQKKILKLTNETGQPPRIGPHTAVRLIAEIGDVKRFENNKQLNAYTGIDIRPFQSGKTFYTDKINKRGSKHLRKLTHLIIRMFKMLLKLDGTVAIKL